MSIYIYNKYNLYIILDNLLKIYLAKWIIIPWVSAGQIMGLNGETSL